MKTCQYCGADIAYSAYSNRGAWYSNGGRVCVTATDEFGMQVQHLPEWDLEKGQWK